MAFDLDQAEAHDPRASRSAQHRSLVRGPADTCVDDGTAVGAMITRVGAECLLARRTAEIATYRAVAPLSGAFTTDWVLLRSYYPHYFKEA